MARTSILNRGEIIEEGLELGNNTGITARAQTFLNLWLDELYASYDWPFLLTEESITIGSSQTFDLSTLNNTFRAVRDIRLEDDEAPLAEWDGDFPSFRSLMLNDADSSSAQTAKPTHYMVDPAPSNDQLYVWPNPDKGYSATIWYYYHPAQLTSDGDTPVLPSAALAVDAVATFAAEYDGSNLFGILEREKQRALIKLRANMRPGHKQRQRQIPFDRNVHSWRKNRF